MTDGSATSLQMHSGVGTFFIELTNGAQKKIKRMYAAVTDAFAKTDISGVVEASTNVSPFPLTWCKRLPKHFDGIPISTEFILLDTKRSASNYKNVIEARSARFCLDNRANYMNDFLLQQVDCVDKKPIRLGEYLSKGSTTILDCGDHHVVGRFDKGVLLRRLKEQTPLPVGRHYKHQSEARAESVLSAWFPGDEFYVNYEPFVLNFSDDSIVIGESSVHCYNVDFRVRKKVSSCNIGIEVKKDIASWEWKMAEALFKIRKYEEIMGAPCLVLIVEPSPRLHRVGEMGIEPFASIEDAMSFVHRASHQ